MLVSRFSSTPFCCLWKQKLGQTHSYCDCFLPWRHCKIGTRLNHGPNLKIINRGKNPAMNLVIFASKNTENMMIMLAVLLLQKSKNYSRFSNYVKIMRAQSIYKSPLILHPYVKRKNWHNLYHRMISTYLDVWIEIWISKQTAPCITELKGFNDSVIRKHRGFLVFKGWWRQLVSYIKKKMTLLKQGLVSSTERTMLTTHLFYFFFGFVQINWVCQRIQT